MQNIILYLIINKLTNFVSFCHDRILFVDQLNKKAKLNHLWSNVVKQ